MTMKNAVFWDVVPWRSCMNRRFGGTYSLHLQGRKIRERATSVSRWLKIAEDGILHSHRCENLKSYTNSSASPSRYTSFCRQVLWTEVTFNNFLFSPGCVPLKLRLITRRRSKESVTEIPICRNFVSSFPYLLSPSVCVCPSHRQVLNKISDFNGTWYLHHASRSFPQHL
jgi:hypothetical protein